MWKEITAYTYTDMDLHTFVCTVHVFDKQRPHKSYTYICTVPHVLYIHVEKPHP